MRVTGSRSEIQSLRQYSAEPHTFQRARASFTEKFRPAFADNCRAEIIFVGAALRGERSFALVNGLREIEHSSFRFFKTAFGRNETAVGLRPDRKSTRL